MLVLSRKIGQHIVIGNDIHITVVAIDGVRVRIGVSAPTGVMLDRQEIHEKRKNPLNGEPALVPRLPSVIDTLRG
jgi:carbon storage regulator